jgi:hypothetical protein
LKFPDADARTEPEMEGFKLLRFKKLKDRRKCGEPSAIITGQLGIGIIRGGSSRRAGSRTTLTEVVVNKCGTRRRH